MPDGKIIAIANQKGGGTGKTCTTMNWGIGLADQGKKVLVVDTYRSTRRFNYITWL